MGSLPDCKPPTTPSRPSLSKDSPSKPRNAQVTDSSSVEQPVVSLRTASQLQLNNLNHGQQKISIVDLEASIFCVKNGLEFDVCKDHHGGGVHAMAVHGGGAEPPATPEKVEEPAPDCAQRAPWLRAALLGGNDGLVSTASLLMGVGAVKEDMKSMVITGLAGLVAGACSMAIGEFVSVYSQRDLEVSQVKRECSEFQKGGPEARAKKLEELVDVFVQRGLSSGLARQVAEELSKGDDVAKVHVQERLGINVDELANPLQVLTLAQGYNSRTPAFRHQIICKVDVPCIYTFLAACLVG